MKGNSAMFLILLYQSFIFSGSFIVKPRNLIVFRFATYVWLPRCHIAAIYCCERHIEYPIIIFMMKMRSAFWHCAEISSAFRRAWRPRQLRRAMIIIITRCAYATAYAHVSLISSPKLWLCSCSPILWNNESNIWRYAIISQLFSCSFPFSFHASGIALKWNCVLSFRRRMLSHPGLWWVFSAPESHRGGLH